MKQYFYLLCLFSILLVSCERPKWESDTVVPLVKSEIRITDRIKGNLLEVGENDIITLKYSQNIGSFSLDSLFKLPDTVIERGFNLAIGNVNVVPGQVILNETSNTFYDINNVNLTRAIVKSGRMAIELKSSLQGDAILRYSIPNALLNGAPFVYERAVKGASSGQVNIIRDTISLDGYDISMRGVSNNLFNSLANTLTITMDPQGSNSSISAGDFLTASTQFIEAIPFMVSGEFRPQIIEVKNEPEPTDIFNNVLSGNFELQNSKLSLLLDNFIGADLQANILAVRSINSNRNEVQSLSSDVLNKNIFVPRATRTGIDIESINQVEVAVEIDEKNSNITELISLQPNFFDYHLQMMINPLGNISGSNDFLFTDKSLQLKLNAEIPLVFSASSIIIGDTATFDIGNKADNEDWAGRIIDGFLVVYVDNYYPFETELQIELLNGEFQSLHNLIPPGQMVQAAEKNADVIEPNSAELRIPLNQDIINKMYDSKFALITFKINSSENKSIELVAGQKIKLNIVGDFVYEI